MVTSIPPLTILGLDIGIGSCGWSLLDMTNKRIIASGVRLWETPQEPKTKASTAATRRAARSARRNTKRNADRKKHCLTLLKKHKLVPADAQAQWLQSVKKDKPVIKLRAEGLERGLTDRQWAQVLYSLCDRRGYIPHGDSTSSGDEGKVLKAVKQNAEKLQAAGMRTVGEMLSQEPRSRNRGGDYSLCVTHNDLIVEVNALFEAQREHGNPRATSQFEEEYLDIFSWQKDVSENDRRIYDQVGWCTYFKNEKRAPKSSLSSQMCEAFERVSHAVWIDEKGTEHKLPPEIKQRIVEVLFSPVPLKGNKSCKVTYKRIREWMELDSDFTFKGVESEKEKTEEIYIPKAWKVMRENLPNDLTVELRDNRELADIVAGCLTYASSEKNLVAVLKENCIDDKDISSLCSLPFTAQVFTGYGSRSLRALDLLISSFEDYENVTTLAQAEEASGLKDMRLEPGERRDTSLPPYKLYDPTCKNPVVLRVMGQVRKVVNAIIKEYGMPNEIHIELARELKQSKHEKQVISERNRATRDAREARVAKITEELGVVPKKSLIKKVEAWEEQGGRCVYCGNPISYERLIAEDHFAEIDHALPFSRTCDDSQSNKVLSCKACNQNKKNRTPYEWAQDGGINWEDFSLRVTRNKKIGQKKRAKLLCTDLSAAKEGEFISRNLNDTRYASRAAKSFIENYLAFPEDGHKQHVFAVAGGATALLRSAWGIRKNREEDQVHHAVDAAVIAACTRQQVIDIARANERKLYTPKSERKDLFKATEPWKGFSEEVAKWKTTIIPTHMVDHKIGGRVFEDTVYAYCGLRKDGKVGLLGSGPKGKLGTKASSNYIVREDGSALIVDELAFINLWLDPEAKKGKGQLLLEPIYRADIPFESKPGYVRKYIPPQSDKKPREFWDPVPERALALKPLTLFPQDVILVKGEIRRFKTINIATCSWQLSDPRGELTDTEATKGLAFLTLDKENLPVHIEEDVLGLVFKRLSIKQHQKKESEE